MSIASVHPDPAKLRRSGMDREDVDPSRTVDTSEVTLICAAPTELSRHFGMSGYRRGAPNGAFCMRCHRPLRKMRVRNGSEAGLVGRRWG